MALAQIAASLFSSSGGAQAPDTLISGFRDVSAGGINTGSKTVGSGSAATTIPASGGAGASSSAASSGVPAWVAWAGLALAAIAVFLAFIPRRRGS